MKRLNNKVILTFILCLTITILFIMNLFTEYRVLVYGLIPLTIGLFYHFVYYTYKERCIDENIQKIVSVSKNIYLLLISLLFAFAIFQVMKHQVDSLVGLTLIGMLLAKALSFMSNPNTK